MGELKQEQNQYCKRCEIIGIESDFIQFKLQIESTLQLSVAWKEGVEHMTHIQLECQKRPHHGVRFTRKYNSSRLFLQNVK